MDKREIRLLRHFLGLTQQQFADLIGCGVLTINRWEKGKFKPLSIYLKKIEELKKQYGFNLCEPPRLEKP